MKGAQPGAVALRGSGVRAAGAHRVASLLTLMGLWWLAARLGHSPQLLPGPLAVARVAARLLADGSMARNIGDTLLRVAAAFTLSMLAGVALGTLAGRSARANALIDPWLVVALNLPVLVVVVLAYIWVGLNETAAVLAVTIAKMPTVIVTLREGARALDPGLDEMTAAFRVPAGRRLGRIVLPQLMPYLAAAGRGGLSITWKIVLVVELLGRPNGVGFALNLFFQDFDVAGILAYGVVFASLMLVVEAALMQPLERWANGWRAA